MSVAAAGNRSEVGQQPTLSLVQTLALVPKEKRIKYHDQLEAIATSGAQVLPDPVLRMAFGYFFIPEIEPTDLIGRVNWRQPITVGRHPGRHEPRQACFFQYEKIAKLFQGLTDFGVQFNCEPEVAACIRQAAETRYCIRSSHLVNYMTYDYTASGTGNCYHGCPRKDHSKYFQAFLLTHELHSQLQQSKQNENGRSTFVRLDALCKQAGVPNYDALDAMEQYELFNLFLTSKATQFYAFSDPALPQFVRGQLEIFGAQPDNHAERAEMEAGNEDEERGFLACICNCLSYVAELFCWLIGYREEEE